MKRGFRGKHSLPFKIPTSARAAKSFIFRRHKRYSFLFVLIALAVIANAFIGTIHHKPLEGSGCLLELFASGLYV